MLVDFREKGSFVIAAQSVGAVPLLRLTAVATRPDNCSSSGGGGSGMSAMFSRASMRSDAAACISMNAHRRPADQRPIHSPWSFPRTVTDVIQLP